MTKETLLLGPRVWPLHKVLCVGVVTPQTPFLGHFYDTSRTWKKFHEKVLGHKRIKDIWKLIKGLKPVSTKTVKRDLINYKNTPLHGNFYGWDDKSD